MPTDQTGIGPMTPMGANVVPGGCRFRAWAPRAIAVYVSGPFNAWAQRQEAQSGRAVSPWQIVSVAIRPNAPPSPIKENGRLKKCAARSDTGSLKS